jgi:uncharacterized protein (DUF58 family)
MSPDRHPTRNFLDPQALARLAAVPLAARRPMVGSVSGRHASPHRGSSVEFAEYRKYVPGDDLRRLDWRAFGRSDRHYVKEYEADTNLRLCLVLDTSGSMRYGSAPAGPAKPAGGAAKATTKLEQGRRLAGSLAYLAAQQGDAVGVACVADGLVQTLPPRRSPAHLRLVLDVIEAAAADGPTRLPEVLHELAETTRQRALVVVVSDLLVPPPELASAFNHLRFRRHDVGVFHVLDPQEIGFEFQRPTRFLDLEGGAAIFADPIEIADRYHRAVAAYLADLRKIVLETGIDYHRVLTSDPAEQALAKFLVGRAVARGLR